MSKLRKLAKGQACQVRIPNICNFDTTTTVLAHIRRGNVAGAGQKPVDLCGVWACSDCHSCVDGRIKSPYSREQLDSFILGGLCRTLTAISAQLKI